jgi:low affinity Fe/Cu permease
MAKSFSERAAQVVTNWAGTNRAFFLAVGVILIWAATGHFFQYSDTWQLVINTGTTIVTFLMVFLIQRTQNKDSAAIQIKLDAILAATHGVNSVAINVEDLSEKEINQLREEMRRRVALMTQRKMFMKTTKEIPDLVVDSEDS